MIYRRLHFLECARYTSIVFPVSFVIGLLLFLSRVFTDLIDNALPVNVLWHLTALLLVKYSPQLLIVSLFCGVLLACARSYQKHEMDAWFVAGIGLRHFILPSLIFALPIITAIFFFSMFASPWAVQNGSILRASLPAKINPETIPAGEFRLLPGGDYVFFSTEDDSDTSSSKIFIAATGGDSHQVIFSRKAVGNDVHGIPYLTLSDGNLYHLPRSGDVSGIEKVVFEVLNMSIPIDKWPYSNIKARPIGRLNWNKTIEQAEIVRRINLPLAALVLTLLALFVSRIHPRMKSSKSFFIGLLLFTIYIKLLYFVDKGMREEEISAWAAVLVPPVGTFISSLALMARRKR